MAVSSDAAAAPGAWALLVPHMSSSAKEHGLPGKFFLAAPKVTIGSGPSPMPHAPSCQFQHLRISHDAFLSRLHLELEHSADGSVQVTNRARTNMTFVNGMPLKIGARVKAEKDLDNARFQLPGEEPDAPIIFCVVPNRLAASRLADHAHCFTGFTLRMQPTEADAQPRASTHESAAAA